MDWLEPIIQAALDAPATERNFSLLCGYAKLLAEHHTDTVQALKVRIAHSPDLAPAFPQLCNHIGVEENDIVLAIDAMQSGLALSQTIATLVLGRCSR